MSVVVKPFTSQQTAAVFGRACPTYDTVIPCFATFGRRLVELAAVAPGEDVLDVASGRGASLLPALDAVGPDGTIIGVDLSAEMVHALEGDLARLGRRNASVRRMDAEALQFPDRSFDVVLCGCAFQLLPHPSTAADGFYRVLRPGGRLGLSAPAETSPGWGFFVPLLAEYLPRAVGPVPPLAAPKHRFADILTAAGFADIRISEESAQFVVPDKEAWWQWTWSVGLRAYLEPLAPDDLKELREAAFAQLTPLEGPGGFHLEQRTRFLLARRPGPPSTMSPEPPCQL